VAASSNRVDSEHDATGTVIEVRLSREDFEMKDGMKTALKTAMDEFDQKRSDAAKRQEAMKTHETEFSRTVERLFKEVVRPAMEKVKNTLGQRNHDCKIVEEDDRRTPACGAHQPDDQTGPADGRWLRHDGLPNDLLRRGPA